MTTTEGLQAVRRIITEGIDRAGHTQASFAAEAKIATKTLHNILRTDRTPSRPVLAKIENTLGLIPGVLSDLADQPAEAHPERVTYASLTDTTTPAPSDMTDAELLWELTARLNDRDRRITALEAQVAELRAAAPADVYALAADTDRSGVGRHLAEQADATGEEPQA